MRKPIFWIATCFLTPCWHQTFCAQKIFTKIVHHALFCGLNFYWIDPWLGDFGLTLLPLNLIWAHRYCIYTGQCLWGRRSRRLLFQWIMTSLRKFWNFSRISMTSLICKRDVEIEGCKDWVILFMSKFIVCINLCKSLQEWSLSISPPFSLKFLLKLHHYKVWVGSLLHGYVGNVIHQNWPTFCSNEFTQEK